MAIETSAGSTYGLVDGMAGGMVSGNQKVNTHYLYGTPDENLTTQGTAGSDLAINIEDGNVFVGDNPAGGSEWTALDR